MCPCSVCVQLVCSADVATNRKHDALLRRLCAPTGSRAKKVMSAQSKYVKKLRKCASLALGSSYFLGMHRFHFMDLHSK